MKKSLVALAALVATGAFAQATITGTVDSALTSTKTTTGAGVSTTVQTIDNNRQGTSNVTFSGAEDLGAGLKAVYLYEADFVSNDAGAAPTAGQIYAGLQGGFGTVKMGAPNTPSLTTQGARSPFGTKTGGRGFAYDASLTRFDGSVVYTAPAFGPVTLSLMSQPGGSANAATAGDGPAQDIGITFASGPFKAVGSSFKRDENKQNSIALNYTMGATTFYLGMHNEHNGTTTDNAGNNFAIAHTMGAVTLMANFSTRDDKLAANNDRTENAIGLKYAFSKNTSAYGRLVSQKTDNLAANSTAAAKTTVTLVGLQVNF